MYLFLGLVNYLLILLFSSSCFDQPYFRGYDILPKDAVKEYFSSLRYKFASTAHLMQSGIDTNYLMLTLYI